MRQRAHRLRGVYADPPYFLKADTNVVAMDYWANTLDDDLTRQYEVSFHIREVELLDEPAVNNKLTIGKELVEIRTPKYPKISEDEKRHLDTTFEWKQPLPVWSWTHGVPIEQTEETKQSLCCDDPVRRWRA